MKIKLKKLIQHLYFYLIGMVFLPGVELMWPTPAMAIDSAPRILAQQATTEKKEIVEVVIDDIDAITSMAATIDPVVQSPPQNITEGKKDKDAEVIIDDIDAITNMAETIDPVVQTPPKNIAEDEKEIITELIIDDFDANNIVTEIEAPETKFSIQDLTEDEEDTTTEVMTDDFDAGNIVTGIEEPEKQWSLQDITGEKAGKIGGVTVEIFKDNTGTDEIVELVSKSSLQNLTPTNKNNNGNSLIDSGSPPKTINALSSNLDFGTRFELEFETEKNFNLDKIDAEDISFLNSALSFALKYTPARNVSMFLNIEPSQVLVVDQRNKKKDESSLDLNQAYLSFKKLIADLDIKVGRQRFKDKREWLYDDELDGIRLRYNFSKATVELSAGEKKSQDLINDGNDEDVINYVLYGSYTFYKKNSIASYIFAQDDSSMKQKNAVFYGLQLNGRHGFNLDNEHTNKLSYWLELAVVKGESESIKIDASGFDIGTTFQWGYSLKPALTFGYAYGSGDDDSSDDVDNKFRQTGLQDNDAKMNGAVRLKYYGEVFDPELSNLIVHTVGFGIWPSRRVSLDLVYHRYRQDELSDNIRDSEIDLDPSGLRRELGQEFDLVMGFTAKKRRSKTSLVIGEFIPGAAFPDASNARYVEIKYKREF